MLKPYDVGRKFDELLPGLGVSLRERCSKLEQFQIYSGSLRLNMFPVDDVPGKRIHLGLAVL